MEHHVIERMTGDRDIQARHVREVRGAQVAWMMYLSKKHLLGRAFRGSPLFHSPLQTSQVAFVEFRGVLPTQPLQNSCPLEPGIHLE